MRVNFNYEKLLENLVDLSIVVEDSMSSEDLKNVIFRFEKDDIKLIGKNQVITFKRTLPKDIYTLDISDEELKDGVAYIQLKSKELIGYLNTYRSLRRTEVEDVELTLVNKLTVVCKVIEKDLDNGRTYLSSYNFNNLNIPPKILNEISITDESEDAGELVPMTNILFYTRNLLPILKNDPKSLFGYLNFGDDDTVVGFNARFTTFMKSKLPKSFSGFKLSFRAISFIDKIFAGDAQVVCKKLDKYLYIYSEETNSEAFITYLSDLPNYMMTKNLFVKDHAFVLDRMYLKDIIKRFSLADENIEFKINCDESVMEVKNTKFHQTIPILNQKALEEYNHISFKILPDTLNKLIIGSDDEFSPQTFVYYCPQPKGAVLVFTDNSGEGNENAWFSTIQVNTYK